MYTIVSGAQQPILLMLRIHLLVLLLVHYVKSLTVIADFNSV